MPNRLETKRVRVIHCSLSATNAHLGVSVVRPQRSSEPSFVELMLESDGANTGILPLSEDEAVQLRDALTVIVGPNPKTGA